MRSLPRWIAGLFNRRDGVSRGQRHARLALEHLEGRAVPTTSTTMLSASASPVNYGQQETLTAMVQYGRRAGWDRDFHGRKYGPGHRQPGPAATVRQRDLHHPRVGGR